MISFIPFSLLGAGKTVTMSILAGQYAPEHGEVALDGARATGEDRRIDHLYENCNVAYCPQFDALFPKKTVEEHLKFYARVRGLDWAAETTQQHIEAIIKLLGLGKHRKKESTQLSGGYKRRLSLGVSMIGYPNVMMVDECTTGLDPAARRLIWDVLKPDIAQDGYDIPAILLSSHYMDECQELGTRIGIMIDGELATTGSLNRLQELYCTSYFVEISLQAHTGEDAEEHVLDAFDARKMSAKVYESLPYHFKLQVFFVEGAKHDDTQQLAQIFDLLETRKDELGIKFYAVALMNLEQIFIDLSRKQFDADAQFETTTSARQVG
jgi:ABC-type multidrug transport system ATPase subunit